jgi:hypothetical protein
VALVHHELCFGCGRTNLFGLLAELEPTGEGHVAGRCFVKQDHQGPRPGAAHLGIIAAALGEAMMFAAGQAPSSFELRVAADAPVGAFLEIEATPGSATATVDGRPVACASASYE